MQTEDKLKPSDFESKWQKVWEEKGVYQPDLLNSKKPFYNLMMFPYPSAEGLHVGNMYAFTGADINGRFRRMQGNDVLEPIGLDGFGIHSENYAIKIGKHPKEQAKVSRENFYRQLHAIGDAFAWKNTLETFDPDYYKWTQWIFTQMYEHDLAYRKKSPVNFCPSCKTVLSDEQVIDGRCERCKTVVEKREMEQWFFKITAYAEKLLQNTFKESFQWSGKVKTGQRNWIGKKTGINITYDVVSGPVSRVSQNSASNRPGKNGSPFGEALFGNPSLEPPEVVSQITCFTTRPDTNFGATFVVIGPEHGFVRDLLQSKYPITAEKKAEIEKYLEKTRKKTETERIAEGREKTGVFTGYYCVNQLTGRKMPLHISDFVLGNVGTGAVVGVPGHDMRDFEFARKFDIPVVRVVVGKDGDSSEITKPEQVQEEEGKMVNSGFLDGLDIHKATQKIMDYLEEKGWGKRVTTYKLRDWCISRQRYWGAPIPMINCPVCGWVSVPESDLPVLLPDLSDWKPEGTGKGPLAKLKDWVKVKCPKCKGPAERETDVCDTFLDSSWYYLRYPSVNAPDKSEKPWNGEITKKWLPVTQYIGGAEHTVLHLLYSRFVTMAFKDWGLLDFEEPFARFYAHGLIIAEGAKMSKSRGNVIIPDEYIKKYGADTLRTYLMFLGPFEAGGDFRDTGIAGMYKFLNRVWRLSRIAVMNQSKTEDNKFIRVMHKTVKEVTEDMENLRYNTAIAHIMEYVNEISDFQEELPLEVVETLLLLLAPFAPHMTEELWQLIKKGGKDYKKDYSIHLYPWPAFNPEYLVEDNVTIIVQINGKIRDILNMPKDKGGMQTEVEKLAKNSEKVQKFIKGLTIRKTIFVPGKLINFVIG